VLDELPKLLDRQVRVARLQTSDNLDTHEAFISEVVFLVPGGQGATEFAVDQIEVHGVLQDRIVDPHVATAAAESEELFAGPVLPNDPDGTARPVNEQTQRLIATPPAIQRIIRWQGEPFEYLAKLGFTATWLSRQPTPAELESAARVGISLICPPPKAQGLTSEDFSAAWDPVLTWDLGALFDTADLEQIVRLKQQIQHCDPKPTRGSVVSCEQISRDASRATDAILVSRPMLGTDLTLREYVIWLGQRQRLVRPGTPLWVTLETELSTPSAQQVQALVGAGKPLTANASAEQLSALTAAAISIKCRNFVFSSNSSLMGKDATSQQRARILELMNMRLQLLTPWLEAGKVAGIAESSQPGLSAMVFQAERSHLLIPVAWSRNFQSQHSFPVSGAVSYVVPSVGESTDAYLITLAGVKRLQHERTTGGLRVSAESLPPDGIIMLTSDPQAFSQVSQYLRRIAGRAARLRRDMVAYRLQELEQLCQNNAVVAANPEACRAIINRSKYEIAACDSGLARGLFEQAQSRANAIEQTLSQAEYALRAASDGSQTLYTPLQFSLATLAEEQQLRDMLSSPNGGTSLLGGGNFEQLDDLLQSGWRHHQLPLSGVTSAVRLSPDIPYEGTYCLELEATSNEPTATISVVPTAPVWITSSGMPVKAGDLVEITGVARVPEELIGTIDGLQIIDSLGGPGMATRIRHAPSWQSFRIVRGVPADTQLFVSIALSGLGRAQIDNLSVRTLKPSGTLATQPSSGQRQ
jgi:hypothetical protein